MSVFRSEPFGDLPGSTTGSCRWRKRDAWPPSGDVCTYCALFVEARTAAIWALCTCPTLGG